MDSDYLVFADDNWSKIALLGEKRVCQFVITMKKKKLDENLNAVYPRASRVKEQQQQGLFIVPTAKVKIKVNLQKNKLN